MTKKNIQSTIYSFLLLLYSLLLVNQGIALTDTGYNYSNFINYNSLDNMWKFSTFLATSVGNFFTHLPYGNTMLGLNIYTGLVKAIIVLMVYYFCVYYFEMKPTLVFFAELMALGYCWCPTAVLYNYLSYLLFTLSAILICLAAKSKKNRYFVFAGVCLGVNVLVRLPNLAEIGLIFAVWFYCYISKINLKHTIKITGLCIGGYLLGIGSILAYISAKYGIKEYCNGIYEMINMPDDLNGYSLESMIRGDIFSYQINMKWLVLALVFVLFGMIFYYILIDRLKKIKRIIYIASNIFLLYIYYKKGMFDFTYYNYDAIESVGIFFLILAGIVGLYAVFFAGENHNVRMHAMTMGLVVLLTPLGSNNYLFSSINNLFWVTPFVFHYCYEWVINARRHSKEKMNLYFEPMRITFIILILFVFIQGLFFGMNFVFRDGIEGEKRTVVVTDIPVLNGMHTQENSAIALTELNSYLIEKDLSGAETIFYNNVPGLAFYLNLKPALSSVWPDMDSFSKNKFELELQGISENILCIEKPLVILGEELDSSNPKQNILQQFMTDNGYELIFSNEICYLYK